MKTKNLSYDDQTGYIKLDIFEEKEPYVIVVGDGKVKQATLPEFGETKIITHQGKIKRMKFDIGEDF
ncbi:XtrA/YqaO family protein [Alkalihalobacillus trypoxylicola]|uniref:Uncharacterized protein n=1 Tax=Alkalihalobacillus trypoxylicola TaxID=519424 RepID=A0A161PCJ7_9BACI|nr:XtrA/YqaO family protein [Alkalihalobacillus trypoxylicola]KYG30427.1 hypothetical protein AZF04_19885 [Alkalihalobacillus trypoxylicola]